jgi:hypothetical protein
MNGPFEKSDSYARKIATAFKHEKAVRILKIVHCSCGNKHRHGFQLSGRVALFVVNARCAIATISLNEWKF